MKLLEMFELRNIIFTLFMIGMLAIIIPICINELQYDNCMKNADETIVLDIISADSGGFGVSAVYVYLTPLGTKMSNEKLNVGDSFKYGCEKK